MAKIALVRVTREYFTPESDDDKTKLRRVKDGEAFVSELLHARIGRDHRRLMALLRCMFENQDKFPTFNDVMVDVKVKCGHYGEYITEHGEIVYLPKSFSYGEMDQSEFDVIYPKVVNLSLNDETYLKGLTEHQLEMEIERRLRFG